MSQRLAPVGGSTDSVEQPGSDNAQQGWRSLLGLLLHPLPLLKLQRLTSQTPLHFCSRQVRRAVLHHKAAGTARAVGATATQCPKIEFDEFALQLLAGKGSVQAKPLLWLGLLSGKETSLWNM